MKKRKENLKYYSTDRTDLKKLIPDNVTYILDIGCGTGETWKEENKYIVTGIEIIPDIAEIAKENLENVIVGDAEYIHFKRASFDCIFMGDILEHLYNPCDFLRKYKKFLRKDGYIIASIPNIQYYKIVKKLMKGEWEYKELGILDFDHIRFFTFKSLNKLFESSGFEILNIDRKIKTKLRYQAINKIFNNKLINFFTVQFFILGKSL